MQSTQQQLNGNLLKEIQNKITENTSIQSGINASVAEFVERIHKAILLKTNQIHLGSRLTLRLDDSPDFTKKLDDFQPTYIKYVGSNLLLAWGYTLQGHQN